MARKRKAEPPKSDLDRLREWLGTYPGYDLKGNMLVDYLDKVPGAKSLSPGGLEEISRAENIWGETTVQSRYNFGLYITVEKAPGDDVGAAYNADWVLDFQKWVQAQSVSGLTPTFGNIEQSKEQMKAENGALYETDQEGVGVYVVALSVEFKTKYEVI